MMEHKKYELSESLARMEKILESTGAEYRRYQFIPDEETLNEHKGSLVNTVVIANRLFFTNREIDVLNLVKIYDIYVSEAWRILAEHELCCKVSMHGNMIVAVYSANTQDVVNGILDVASRLSSLPDVINVKIGRKQQPLIGNVCSMNSGFLYTLKTPEGYDYFGGVMNRAESWICNKYGDGGERKGTYISKNVYDFLKSDYQEFFRESDEYDDVYWGMIENIGMARWIKEQK